MGMDVDPSRGDEESARIDLAFGSVVCLVRFIRLALFADAHDFAIANTDVRLEARCSGSIDDGSASNDQVEHIGLLRLDQRKKNTERRGSESTDLCSMTHLLDEVVL
jgi:hypothetical protein